MDHLTGSSGFSIVLYGKDAYTPEELAAHSLPEELTNRKSSKLRSCAIS